MDGRSDGCTLVFFVKDSAGVVDLEKLRLYNENARATAHPDAYDARKVEELITQTEAILESL